MLIPIGTIVLHPLYPQWGEGVVIGHREVANEIRFEDRPGRPGYWAAENLMDQDGHRFVTQQEAPVSRRSVAAAERAAAKLLEEQENKMALEESIRDAVNYLTSIADQVTIGQVCVKTQEQADEFVKHAESRGVVIHVIVDNRYWGLKCCLEFPVLVDNMPPFPVVKKAGYRGPGQKQKPQGRIYGSQIILCNTEVALRLLEKRGSNG